MGSGGTAAREAERPPTTRVPGASVAARAAANGRDDTWADIAKRPAPPKRDPSTTANQGGKGGAGKDASQGATNVGMVDEDGFQEVLPRKGRKGTTGTDEGKGGRVGTRVDAQAADQGTVQAGEDGNHGAAGQDEGGEDEGHPSAADLQQHWHQEIALVKRLRSQGLAEEHPAMRAACEARDAAERAWRDTKEPAPVAVRLGRAQSKLDRAITLQGEARAAMREEERRHRERMADLQSSLDECTERVKMRRHQLQEIQAELGTRAPADGGIQRAQLDAIRKVHSTICGDVGPTIAALVDQLDSGAPAWSALNAMLAKLQESKDALESVSAAPRADRFDIGDQDDGQWDNWSNWSESHDVQGQHWGRGGAGDGDNLDSSGDTTMGYSDDAGGQDHGYGGHGSYDNWGCAPFGGGDRARDTESGEWWDAHTRRWGSTVRWQAAGHGKWSRASWADQLEEEGGEQGDDSDPPPPARRRLETADDGQGAAGAAQQQQQPTTPNAASGGTTGTTTSNNDPAERARKHTERINAIVTMAIEAGVTPLTAKGEELCMLDAVQLEAWVAECLPAALLC